MSGTGPTGRGPYPRLLYKAIIFLAMFSGMGQMPILKRYYFTDLPLMGWSEDFFILSDIHYISAALLLGLFAWRFTLSSQGPGGAWGWGPRSWWGWALLAALAVTGAFKALRNVGVYISPPVLMWLDFTHLGSAMALMFTGLGLLFRKPGRQPAQSKTA